MRIRDVPRDTPVGLLPQSTSYRGHDVGTLIALGAPRLSSVGGFAAMSIIGFLDSVGHDVRRALRGLLRRPAFTFAAVLTLALGIGATTAIFSVVYSVLIKPLPYPNAGELVRIRHSAGGAIGGADLEPTMYLTKEIGIRSALGAEPRQLKKMFLLHGLKLSGVGVVVGLVVAAALGRWLSSVLFGVGPMDLPPIWSRPASSSRRRRSRATCPRGARQRSIPSRRSGRSNPRI